MRKLLFFILFLPNLVFAHPHTNVGISAFAIQHKDFPCDIFLDSLKGIEKVHVSILWNTFGTEMACLQRLVNHPQLASLQIHTINEVCVRNGRCGLWEVAEGESLASWKWKLENLEPRLVFKIQTYLADISDFVTQEIVPRGIQCYIDPALETRLDFRGMENLVQIHRDFFPTCNIQSNFGGVGDSKEVHGSSASAIAPCMANLDGEDIDFPERDSNFWNQIPSHKVRSYIDRFAHCQVVYLWTCESNCIGEMWEYPRYRNCPDHKWAFHLTTNLIREAQGYYFQEPILDLYGRPLPSFILPEWHEEIVRAVEANDIMTIYNHWVSSAWTIEINQCLK